MSGYIPEIFSTPRAQLLTTAVVSGAAVATLIFGFQALEREERLSALKSSIPSISEKHHTTKVRFYIHFKMALAIADKIHHSSTASGLPMKLLKTRRMPETLL